MTQSPQPGEILTSESERLADPPVERTEGLGSFSPEEAKIPTEGHVAAVLTFGHGRFVIDTGSYNQTPAVFICPVDEPGNVGASARKLGHDRHTLLPGEMVLTFPFFEQAQAVADAMVTAPPPAIASGSVGMERGNAVRNEPSPSPKPDVAGARERLLADLKSRFRGGFYSHTEPDALCQAAADEIKRQGEEIERLRGALESIKWRCDPHVRIENPRLNLDQISKIVWETLAARARQGGPDHG